MKPRAMEDRRTNTQAVLALTEIKQCEDSHHCLVVNASTPPTAANSNLRHTQQPQQHAATHLFTHLSTSPHLSSHPPFSVHLSPVPLQSAPAPATHGPSRPALQRAKPNRPVQASHLPSSRRHATPS
ncbi:hypothetical protein E2C01_043180 [Portunus trituberculatus]|uniref:Uncharacterized protein n=1 Tax=Portunus trituberculatus TaxID=210409 RepID=A0A5B7FPK9_PORTR|nr:hypothetical protein [Portunus trituberculatus]